MLQKTKCWIIIYFALLKCTSSNTVFHTIENRAFALPILLVQLVSPSLHQAALLHSPFSGSDVYDVASAMAWGFTSPRIKSDNSPPFISVPRLSIPAHQPQLAISYPSKLRWTSHRIYPALHHGSRHLKRFTKERICCSFTQ